MPPANIISLKAGNIVTVNYIRYQINSAGSDQITAAPMWLAVGGF